MRNFKGLSPSQFGEKPCPWKFKVWLMGTLKAFINISFQKINKVWLQILLQTKTTTSIKKINMITCPFGLGSLRHCVLSFKFRLFFFFSTRININCTVHVHGFTVQEKKCTVHRTYNHFIEKYILKMRMTTLFTHLKIIFLQSFKFSVFSKISCIGKDPTHFENQNIDYMFFIFLTDLSNFVIIGYYLLYDA